MGAVAAVEADVTQRSQEEAMLRILRSPFG
jgi:hypothetical protein